MTEHTETYRCHTCGASVLVHSRKRWARALFLVCNHFIIKRFGNREACGARMTRDR